MAASRIIGTNGVATALAVLFCTGASAMVPPCSHTAVSQQSCSCNDATSNTPKPGSIVNGDLTVPNGDTCTLNNVAVTRNVSLGRNSSLNTCGNTSCGTKIMHDLDSNSSANIDLSDTSVGHDLNVQKADTICLRNSSAVFHDVTIQGTTGTVPPGGSGCSALNQNSICDSQVGHDLNLLSNLGAFAIGTTGATACISPGTVDVGHDLHVSHNAAVSINNDDIDHDLNCDNNTPNPTNTQSANALGGKAHGQCASFTTTKDKDN